MEEEVKHFSKSRTCLEKEKKGTMSTVAPKLMGRWGNQLFIYSNARAYAEQAGHQFVCQPWLGQKVFELNDEPQRGEPDIWINGYCQNQDSLIYTRKQVKEWFTLRDDFRKQLEERAALHDNVAHLRRGDYAGYGYVVVSMKSYEETATRLGLADVHYFSEENNQLIGFPDELDWLANFYTMTKAKVLLRANSTFSWWAATLGDGKIYSPVIDGLKGGQEQDCQFVEGNWPKFCELPNITDLHLKEE